MVKVTDRTAMRTPIFILALIWPLQGRASDCVAPTTRAAALAALESLEASYKAANITAVLAADDALLAVLRCEGEVLDPSTSALIHLDHGMARWVAGDREAASAAFRAAAALRPGAGLDPLLVPQGHPMHATYAAATSPPAGAPLAVWTADHAQLWVDGSAASSLPQGRASIAQVVATDGRVRWSAYLGGDGLPEGAPLSLRAPDSDSAGDRDHDDHRRQSVALYASSGAALLGAGGLWAASFISKDDFLDTREARTAEQLHALKDLNQLEVLGATGLGVAGAALLGAGVALQVRF